MDNSLILETLWNSLAASIREAQGLSVHDPSARRAPPIQPFEVWRDQDRIGFLKEIVFRRWKEDFGIPLA